MFNGIGENSHETFFFQRKHKFNGENDYRVKDWIEKHQLFDCTKTARKPYDVPVCLILLSIKEHMKENIQISSDGGTEEWMPIFHEYNEMFKGRELLPAIKDLFEDDRLELIDILELTNISKR